MHVDLGVVALSGFWPLLISVCGFLIAPDQILKLVVKIYPHSDSRRDELIAELHSIRWFERPRWMVEQIETVLRDGARSRIEQRRCKSARAELLKRASEVTMGAAVYGPESDPANHGSPRGTRKGATSHVAIFDRQRSTSRKLNRLRAQARRAKGHPAAEELAARLHEFYKLQ